MNEFRGEDRITLNGPLHRRNAPEPKRIWVKMEPFRSLAVALRRRLRSIRQTRNPSQEPSGAPRGRGVKGSGGELEWQEYERAAGTRRAVRRAISGWVVGGGSSPHGRKAVGRMTRPGVPSIGEGTIPGARTGRLLAGAQCAGGPDPRPPGNGAGRGGGKWVPLGHEKGPGWDTAKRRIDRKVQPRREGCGGVQMVRVLLRRKKEKATGVVAPRGTCATAPGGIPVPA